MRRISFVLPVLLIALAHAIQDEAVKIAWAPAAGTKLKYRFTNIHSAMTVSWVDSAQITKVEGDQVTISRASSDLKVTDKDGNPSDINVQIGDNDELLSLNGDVPAQASGYELEMSYLGGFRYPDKALKKGESCSQVFPASGPRPKASASCSYVGAERVGDHETQKLDYEFKVDGGPSAKGTVWLSNKDGMLVKRTTQLSGVNFGAGEEETKQEVARIG